MRPGWRWPLVRARLPPPSAAWRSRWGWLCGSLFFLILLRWLNFTFREYSAIPWPLAWLPTALLAAYCGLYLGVFAAAVAWITSRRSSLLATLAAPFLWVAVEWLRGRLMGGFPWGTLGYSQYRRCR